MEIFDIIATIPTLRELKLAENDLHGDLSPALCNLTALEVVELQSNKLTSLPKEIGQLTRLRTLNVFDNQLHRLPMELFTTSLIELRASKNQLQGTIFSVDTLPHLQELHLANNSIVSLCEGNSIDLPALRILNLATNRLTSLPEVSTWTSLTTLLVGENKLPALPEGFVTLPQLRSADFTGNDITQLDEKIALMESLEHLTVAANPLRERKFLTMATDEIKRDLVSRLPAADVTSADGDGDVENDLNEGAGADSGWQVSQSGTLDLSAQNLSTIDEQSLDAIADSIRQLTLQKNIFEAIPLTLSRLHHLGVLDLSRNAIEVPLSSPLDLPKLRELRLNGNKLKSLEPLTTQLTAPSLQILDVSQNRLSGPLLVLRDFFPELITLLASDNSLSEVSAESLTGLKIVNLSNNDIERLEPRIGLLRGTLTGLEVEGNKFRVPNYQILKKGTDAVLTWLRDKIPRESWKSDGTEVEFFDAVDGESF